MSKDMAEAIMDWIKSSSFGRKYGKQILKGRIHALIKPADAWGIERFFSGRRVSSGKLKQEWKNIVSKIKESVINEQMTPSQVKFLSGQLKLKKGDKITYDQHFQFGKVSKNVTAKVIAVNGHTVFLDKGVNIDLRQDPIKKVNNKVIK